MLALINYYTCLVSVFLTWIHVNGLLLDASSVSGVGGSVGGSPGEINLDNFGTLERSIAAVFNKVAYGSTTTKRSIPDNVFVPSLTTVPTPLLTTFR